MRVEYWEPTGEFTASGCTRFVKATIAPPHGHAHIIVTFNEWGAMTNAKFMGENDEISNTN